MSDYFDAVESEVREAQRRDPDIVLPWSWWKEQAQRHGMSPHAVYTRATKNGLYVHPSKRNTLDSPNTVEQHEVNEVKRGRVKTRKSILAQPEHGRDEPESPLPEGTASEGERSLTPPPSVPTAGPPPRPTSIPASLTLSNPPYGLQNSGGIGEAIQGFSVLLERAAGMERQVEELNRSLEQARSENRRLRRALREMEGIAEKIRGVYLSSLNGEEH